MSISFAATPQAKEAQQARTYTDPSAGAPPSRRSGANAPFIDKDHWNKVFTEPEYFDAIAKQKGMAEGAKVSLHGDDYVYRQAMIGYMSATRNVPLDDMRKIFDAEKDGFAKKVLGKQTASARELFDWHKTKFERDNEKQGAARQIMEGVIQRSLQDALSGGDTPFVESVAKDIDAASDYFDDEEKSRLWEKAEELDMKIRATQDRFAPEARFIFDALQQYSGQKEGFGAPDMRDLAGRFASLPDNQRKAIYELVGGFASITKTDKGFFYQLAESLGRGTTDITERVPRNFREQTLRGQLRLLESDQPVFRATGVAGAEFSAAGSTPVFGATQGQMLTPEEREQAIGKIQADLGVLKVERELRDLAERVVDPIKMTGVLPEIIEEGLYGAARSIPYTAAAAVPFAGVPAVASALFSSNYDNIMLEYPDIDPDKAALIAAISAPIEAGLERMKVNTIMGRLPFFGRWVEKFQHPNQRNIVRIAIGGAGVLAEQNAQEILQNATFPFVQMIGSALDKDIPEYNLDLASMPRSLAVQFVALLPLSLMGIGALSYREISRGEQYLRSKDNLERAGYNEEQIDRITGAATADEAQSILREESKKRDPEKVKAAAQRIVDESIALREKANPAALPRLEKQGADYVVLSPEGKELARERDQTAAEQALVSARRETVQREMRDVHTGINEAVEFIKKVNEARQRGEDIAEVIRENAPRTLLTDYEANPTQENLDRLFETVRAFGQEINEPAELANFPVIGSNQGALAEGIWRSVIRINEGADGTIVMREFAQDNLKRAIAEGRVTMDFVRQQLNEILPQIDSDRMERRLRTETDTDVIEAFSDIAVAYFRGSIREEQIPAGLRGIMRRLAIATRDIFRRAYNLARLRAEGKLDRDFEALLAEAVGVDQQALVDRARERTEQEVGATQNYSISLPAGTEVRWQQMQPNDIEGEDRLNATSIWSQNTNDAADNLLYGELTKDGKVVGRIMLGVNEGGIPAEVDKIWIDDSMRRQGAATKLLYAAMQEAGVSMAYAPNLTKEGDAWWSTIAREIPDPQSGDMVDRVVFEPSNYSIGISPTMDADYLAAVERGDMETAQRMVDEAAKAAGYTYGPLYHSRLSQFNKFEPYGKFMGASGVSGIHLTDSKKMAERYLERYADSGWVEGKPNQPFQKEIIRVYAKIENPLMRDEPFATELRLGAPLPAGYVSPVARMGHDALIRNDAISRSGAVKHGATKNAIAGKEFILTDPAKIKSADPVTYDASGNVIPLSQRFDATTADINYSIGKPDKDGIVRESDDQTEAGTLAPDTDLTQLDPDQQQGDDWQDIPWEQTEKNYSIGPAVLPEAYPVLDQDLYEQILAETQTTAAIHIDRLRVGKYEGVDLQGGMYFPAIVDNLKQGVVWAFNSKGVATAVAERARANGGYVKLVLMLEGNVIGNKTFANIWFKQLRKNIKAGKITEADALAEMNTIRERYVTQSVKGETKKFTGHDQVWTSLKQAKAAILAMPQIKRGASYFQKTSTVTKRDGEKIAYQSLLSQAMTGKGFPDAAKIVEAIEEPAFKGLPKGTIVGLIKIDPDAVPMTAAEAGVPEHLSYGFVLKGKPVARMAKFQTLDALFPQIAGKLMSQQATDFPAQQVLNYSIGSRAQPDVKRNVITLPDVTISGPANYSIAAWHASPHKYDKVDLSKAGTGEGAAVYGWGFYMAENPAVSGDGGAYQLQFQQDFDTGRRPRITINGKAVNASNLVEFIDDVSDRTYNTLTEYFMAQRSQDFVRYTDRVKRGDWEAAFKEGVTLNEPQIYRVEVDAEVDELLDWDKPLADQSKFVQNALRDLIGTKTIKYTSELSGLQTSVERVFIQGNEDEGVTEGAGIYRGIARLYRQREPRGLEREVGASMMLKERGIKGIRYLDQGSRGAPTISKSGSKFVVFLQSDQGTPFDTREEAEAFAAENQTYNYVIFDDSLIKILTRNGEQISVEQAAQEVSNYSISTQSEIDRVQAAMGALDRSPLDTLEITEKLRKRFASIMAENMVELAAMRQGGVAEREVLDEEGNPIGPQPDAPRTKASGAEIRRTKLLQALGELDGLLSALPPQVAAKVGGYTVLTNIGTGDRALSNFFIKRLEMIDKELERYLKDRYTKAMEELFKRARPKRDEAGKTPKGKLGADIHTLFARLEQAVDQKAVEIDGEIASLEQQIASGELEPEQEAASILLSDALPLFGEWATADASRMAQAVQMGYDIFRVAYKKQKAKAILRKNLRDQERIDAKDASGAPDDTAPVRQKNKNEAEDFKSKAKGVVTNLLSFDQLMSLTFGRDSVFTKKWVNWQRKADNAKDDEFNAVYEQYAQFLATLTGHPKPYSMKATYAGQDLGYELALPQHKIKHTNVFGEEVEFEFSQADLMDITMMWMQPKGRAHMMGKLDEDGNPSGSDWHYDQTFIDKAERLLTDKAKAIRAFLLNDYAEQWASLNEVFVKLNDINLPQELFYSPLSVNPIQASQNQTIDALTGFPIAVPNRTPPSLRSRGAAVAEPVFSNAIDKWFAHRLQMAHWKAYAEFNNEALSVLGHRNVRNAVEAKLGPAGLVSLQHFITFFQQGGNRAADANLELTKALRGILGRAMTMSLFGRIGTVMIQFTQLGAASAKMPVHAYLRRFFKLMSGQMGWGEALKSPYIQRRIAQMPPQVQVAMAGLRANKPSQIREAARRVGWLLSGNDGLATAGTYAMVYDYQLEQMKKAGMTGAQAETAAREEAERVTDEIAQPTRAGARSAFELSQTSPLQTVAWAFGSEPRKNLALYAYLQRAKRPLDEKGRALLYVLVINGAFAALMRTMLRDLRDDEDDELFDWDDTWNPKRLLMMVLTEPLYGVPVLGEMTEEAIFRAAREYRPEGSLYSVADPAFSLSRVPQHFSNLLEGEVDGRMLVKDINNILRGFGYAYPTAAGAAALSNLGKEFYEMGDTIFGDDE